jgi:multidrug efflux pump subunit AcrA (membrane-fusion protein)
MRPTFRSDLTCSREEQQGVVFYRIDDPRAQTSFRLYEIEYLIAKKLDGSRHLAEVIDAVKNEFNFDISEPDLQRFVNQLESMGFLMPRDGPLPPSAESEPETALMDRPQAPTEAAESGLNLLDEGGGGEPDRAELDRLLRSAFLHVKQGYVVHARDYFLAARELDPADERLAKLVHHLEIIGDSSGPAEVEYLWNQARELFPDVAEEVGPLDARSGGLPELGEADFDLAAPGEEDVKSRLVWALIALVVLAGGIGGLAYVFSNYGQRILGTASQVRVMTLKPERIPVYFDGGAANVSPLETRWMAAGSDGTIERVEVTKGQRVEKGALLVALEFGDRMSKQLAKANKARRKADAAFEKAAQRLEKLNMEREVIEAERTVAEEKLKELTPKGVHKQGGVSKREIEKWRDVKVEANRKLSRLAKKERGPKKQHAKAKKKRDAAVDKVDNLYGKIANKLVRADMDGVVEEVRAAPGKAVKAKHNLVLLRDPSGVQLIFELAEKPDLQPGGQAHVSVSRGAPNLARVLEVTEASTGEATVAVKLPDPSGGFDSIEPGEFRLVQEFADPAFSVPVSAVVEGDEGFYLLVAQQQRAVARSVMVLQRDAVHAVIRDKSGALREGITVVTARTGDLPLSEIPDGSFLEVEK